MICCLRNTYGYEYWFSLDLKQPATPLSLDLNESTVHSTKWSKNFCEDDPRKGWQNETEEKQ
jgi:hypothetical protein